METKYLLESGNTLEMFEIHKYWNKIFQKDEYFHSEIHCLTLDSALQYWERYFVRGVPYIKLVYFSDLLDFKYAYFVNKTKFGQVLKIYTHLSKSYKNFVTGKFIYFWEQDG